MVLVFSLNILLLIFSIFRISFFSELKNGVDFAHSFCLNQVPQLSSSAPEIKALVCAENFSNLSEQQLYISSGLIHLFVVSGAHLLFIEQFLNNFSTQKKTKNKLPFAFIFSVLFLYSLMCGLNPPVTRCLIAVALNQFLYDRNIKWPAPFRLLIAGLLTLVFCPAWIGSLSLQMSWVAAFTVAVISEFFKNKSIFFTQSLFFIFLYPTIMWFQAVSPSIILTNLFLAPVLEFLLFPAAFLVWALNYLSPLFDLLIKIFNGVLINLEFTYAPNAEAAPPNLVIYNWLLVFVLQFLAHLVFVYRRQKRL